MYVQLFTLPSCCRFVNDGEMKSEYPIVIGGENFGCGSSREHAPVCMGAAGAIPAPCYASQCQQD